MSWEVAGRWGGSDSVEAERGVAIAARVRPAWHRFSDFVLDAQNARERALAPARRYLRGESFPVRRVRERDIVFEIRERRDEAKRVNSAYRRHVRGLQAIDVRLQREQARPGGFDESRVHRAAR